MKRALILLSSALVLAVGAHLPKDAKLDYDAAVFAGTGGPYAAPPRAARPVTAYPPCRPGRGDDRCIQLYERRVRIAIERRRAAAQPAMGGPNDAPYPACSRLITDECVQHFDRAPRADPPARPRRGAPASDPAEARTPGI